jgi:hypothetical protein
MGCLKGTIWQLLAAKYGDVVAKLPRLDKNRRRLVVRII